MNKAILILFITGMTVQLFADSEAQTDWSGGPGVLGPVIELGTDFYTDTGVFYSNSSSLSLTKILMQIPLKTIISDSFSTESLDCADINGDGYIDVLCSNTSANDVIWLENANGLGSEWIEHIIDGDFDDLSEVNSADINGDGYLDVIGAGDEYYIPWWENVDGSGTTWIKHIIVPSFFYGKIATFDVNGDGYMDVIVGSGNSQNDVIQWWENVNGLGLEWIEHSVTENNQAVALLSSEDINGDGYIDIISLSNLYSSICWWENIDGSGSDWTKHYVSSSFSGAIDVCTADINGDGYPDVIGASLLSNNKITWWENLDGSGTDWIEHTVGGNFAVNSAVYSADINGDGFMDVVGTLENEQSIIWYENVDGLGIDWIEHLVDEDFWTPRYLSSADINGDGYPDVVVGASSGYEIAWWNPHEYAPEGSLESSILDTESSPQWGGIEWNSSVPDGTDLYFQYKASDDPGEMGMWSDPLYEPCLLSGLLDRYFQYKVVLESNISDISPSLYDVTLHWDPVSIGETTEFIPPTISLLSIAPNPSAGSPVIRFGLPESSDVGIYIFDLSGRLVGETYGSDYSSGYHDVQLLVEMLPGVYFCGMISGDFAAEQRFVVIE